MRRSPIKILHVVFFLEPGGMENGIVNVTNALDPNEFEVHCCCLERPGAFVERLPRPENVHVLGKRNGFSFRAVFDLLKLIIKLRPHVLHSHNLGPLIYSGIASGLGMLCPIVHGEHSLITQEECAPRRLRQRKLLFYGCRKVHTVSEELRVQMLQLGFSPEKIVVLRNGVDIERFAVGEQSLSRQQIALPGVSATDFVLGIVGRFGAFKRHALLIEAFAQLAKERTDIHLLIVGDAGPEKDRVRLQARESGASDRIHFAGYQKDVRPFYRAMDVLVAPSVNEGLSNAILEAMACAVPVLANQACGNSEVIRHGVDGFIADLGTADKLASELRNVLAIRSQLPKIGRMARENIISHFSIQSMVDQYAALYRRNAAKE